MKICTKCEQPGEFSKHKRYKDGLLSWCKICVRANNVKWVKENPDKKRAKDARWVKENPDKVRTKSAKWRKENPDKNRAKSAKWRKENPDKVRANNVKWLKENPDKHRANNAKRHAAKLRRTPPWLTNKHFKEIEKFYTLAKELQWLSEVKLEVDHVIPLQGDNVSGLHVPWNLQILPKSMNCSKGNRYAS